MEEEKQYVPKKYKRKHMWWRYLLVFVGGVLFTAVGAAAGAAIYSTTVPTSQIVGLFPSELQAYLSYFSENGNETLFSTVMNFINDPESVNNVLKSIELPDVISEEMVGKGIHQKLCYYYTYTPEEGEEETVPVAEAARFTVTAEAEEKTKYPHPINLWMLINGKIPTLEEGKYTNLFENLLSTLCLSDVMDTTGSPFDALKSFPILEIGDKIMDVKLGDFIPDGQGMVKLVGDKTLKELTEDGAFDDVALADVLGVDETHGDKLTRLICFRKTSDGKAIDYSDDAKVTIGDLSSEDSGLQSIFDSLMFDDVFDVDEIDNPIINSLVGVKIKDIPEKIQNVSVMDIFPDETESPIINWLRDYKEDDKSIPIYRIDNVLDQLPLVTAVGEDKIFKPGTTEFQKEWKYLLVPESGDMEAYKTYTIKDFDKLMENMTFNMKNATLNQLKEDDFLTDDITDEMLGKRFTPTGPTIGEMTISEIILAAASLATF